ncbi:MULTISPECIES: haloacid dehalogenase type II [unclassified Haloferax]|uniref:haloacid dehalogenase type II n=1 Tax=Haloferax TaxID=2251 RepID=UPI0002B17D7C|nr:MULTISPECIES: haloacid dehalogenase type II [unclassified Haloferax]ELZ55467.1 haloacid dehalogenase [Haloferax sp. ATCC BAA-646]ELZ67409.1 haloacid dehalogenase [Haloferax sp. ATCC BAA-645]ELZ67848.1 haloacid dehalogenase [Haloferax sp. ATCC BAA-644]
MSFDPDRVSTVTFDSYSTLVDVDAAEKALAERVEDPEPVSKLWRSRSLEYTFVGNHVDEYEPFYEVNRAALQYALDAHGVSVSASERDEILSVYHELDVFDDVRDAVGRLRDAGYDCYVVSNGNPEMLDSMVDHADIRDLLDGVVSADEVAVFKPDAELYRHAAARTGTPIDEIAHATAGWFDVMGAQHAGMQGVWVDRKASPWEPFGPEPDITVPDLTTLVEALAGGGPSAAD